MSQTSLPADENPPEPIIMFQPFASSVHVAFWQELGRLKVDVLGLDQRPLDVTGTYAIAATASQQGGGGPLLPPFSLSPDSLKPPSLEPTQPSIDGAVLLRECRVPGVLKNFNTIEAFKDFDRNAWLQEMGQQVWGSIEGGEAVTDPALLCRFSALCFADLKKNRYVYWFGFPTLAVSPPYTLLRPVQPLNGAGGALSTSQCAQLHEGITALRRTRLQRTGDPYCPPFFLILPSETSGPGRAPLRVEALEEYETIRANAGSEDVWFAMIDPATVPSHPGWPLRNLLALLANRWGLTQATVLCYRGRLARIDAAATSTQATDEADVGPSFLLHTRLSPLKPQLPLSVLGWEKNAAGKNGPRQMDLGRLMDPIRLAEQSVDLNLKLMRWRLLPALDLPKLTSTKCLLIGAGTLGCGVARCLLGWGVRHITFIDNGRVSLSNPVRQSLFTFDDCMAEDGNGRLKAPAAADALKEIFPGVVSEGIVMTIPMPGHPLTTPAEVDEARSTAASLDSLVSTHDVVFLLTDTRESRWLPTLLAQVHDKMLLNAALGFDSFVVMRHGGGSGDASSTATDVASARLGCYFCNDVVGPQDSTKDRTLDQQCTVTRPGLAQVASALAVELMVALLHHPQRHHAPADSNEEAGIGGCGMMMGRLDDPQRPLGILPQQIRGYLSHFTNILPVTRAFRCCTACSEVVKADYRANGFDLVLKACNSLTTSYLEEITGIVQLRAEAEAADLLMDGWDEDEDEEIEGVAEGLEGMGVGGEEEEEEAT